MWVGRGISGRVRSRVCRSIKRNQGAEVIPLVGGGHPWDKAGSADWVCCLHKWNQGGGFLCLRGTPCGRRATGWFDNRDAG